MHVSYLFYFVLFIFFLCVYKRQFNAKNDCFPLVAVYWPAIHCFLKKKHAFLNAMNKTFQKKKIKYSKVNITINKTQFKKRKENKMNKKKKERGCLFVNRWALYLLPNCISVVLFSIPKCIMCCMFSYITSSSLFMLFW